MSIFEKYFDFLLTSFMADLAVYNSGWMFFIFPAIFYTIFIMLKYWVFTIPLWLPFQIIFSSFKKKEK